MQITTNFRNVNTLKFERLNILPVFLAAHGTSYTGTYSVLVTGMWTFHAYPECTKVHSVYTRMCTCRSVSHDGTLYQSNRAIRAKLVRAFLIGWNWPISVQARNRCIFRGTSVMLNLFRKFLSLYFAVSFALRLHVTATQFEFIVAVQRVFLVSWGNVTDEIAFFGFSE